MPPIGTALNDCTWDEISLIANSGMAADYFSVGDIKTIILNGKVGNSAEFSRLILYVFIIGIDHNSTIEGSNTIHFQIGKTDYYDEGTLDICLVDNVFGATSSSIVFSMNTSATSTGGWKDSSMRNTVLGNSSEPKSPVTNSLMAALPSDLRKVMKPITKYTDNQGASSGAAANVSATTDYLWLLSEFEVYGSTYLSNSSEKTYQKQYDYYKTLEYKNKYRHYDISSVNSWLRSYKSASPGYFCTIPAWSSDETSGSGAANYSYGIAPAFAV
jgi:hypothetical protein